MRIDRDNPLNRTDGYLAETVAAAIAADWHGAEADSLRSMLAACRDDAGSTVPYPLAAGHTVMVSAGQLADCIRHEVSRQIAENRRDRQLDGLAERLASAFPRVSPVWDRRMRRNGSARRSSVIVLS